MEYVVISGTGEITGKERNNEILLPAWPCMSLRGRKLLIDGMEPVMKRCQNHTVIFGSDRWNGASNEALQFWIRSHAINFDAYYQKSQSPKQQHSTPLHRRSPCIACKRFVCLPGAFSASQPSWHLLLVPTPALLWTSALTSELFFDQSLTHSARCTYGAPAGLEVGASQA